MQQFLNKTKILKQKLEEQIEQKQVILKYFFWHFSEQTNEKKKEKRNEEAKTLSIFMKSNLIINI